MAKKDDMERAKRFVEMEEPVGFTIRDSKGKIIAGHGLKKKPKPKK